MDVRQEMIADPRTVSETMRRGVGTRTGTVKDQRPVPHGCLGPAPAGAGHFQPFSYLHDDSTPFFRNRTPVRVLFDSILSDLIRERRSR